MRAKAKNSQISVRAVAGTSVVLLGFDIVNKAARKGHLGFAVQCTGSGRKEWLRGGRAFEGQSLKDRPDSRTAPIQAFTWSDFKAQPGKTYSYTVHGVYGSPEKPKLGQGLKVTVTTEQPDDGKHGCYFNRAVAGSQAYARRFGDAKRYYPEPGKDKVWWSAYIKPDDVQKGDAYAWLARGLDQAMLKFIRQAKGKKYGLRAAVYEFNYKPALQAFSDALERGADVRIVHHAKRESDLKLVKKDGSNITLIERNGKLSTKKNRALQRIAVKDSVTRATQHAIADVGIKKRRSAKAREQMMIERINTGAISHNKFIVLLERNDDGELKPKQVWTGSTNYTVGGIFGQSNVGHVIRDEKIAQAYLDYWEALSEDPKKPDMQKRTVAIQPDLPSGPPPKGMTPIFSPRPDLTMLHWYGERMMAAKQSVHLTAAFGVGGLKDYFKKDGGGRARYILMESLSGAAKKSYEVISVCDQNRIAWGDTRKRSKKGDDEHLVEALTGLNDHVSYVHTKYMLIDALTDDPIVISGSANFSDPSTRTNDENMVIIRGNTRVADIYLTEFMRFFKHFQFRNEERERGGEDLPLANDESWTDVAFKQGTKEYDERLLFR